jgi:formate C-acetyltransferase
MSNSIIGKMTETECTQALSGQEIKLKNQTAMKCVRPRSQRMLDRFNANRIPRIDIQRAVLFTEGVKANEACGLMLRNARGQANVFEKLPVEIYDNELIVGTAGGEGRHAILFPELRAEWFSEGLKKTQQSGTFTISDEEIEEIKQKVVPFWQGKSYAQRYEATVPNDIKAFTMGRDDSTPVFMQDYVGANATINYVINCERVLTEGIGSIIKECEERIAKIRSDLTDNNFRELEFLQSAITVCRGIVTFANRYADKAEEMAFSEKNEQRKAELECIAENCRQVPENPPKDFWQALQSVWFVQIGYCLEQQVSGNPALGRMDQYLYPFYKKDIAENAITDEDALELLDCLWFKLANYLQFNTTNAKNIWEGYAHFEDVTIGGVDRYGHDATNELTYLLIRSKKEFPLHYPELALRVHSGTPNRLLHEAAELIKDGTGFPKLFNDEEIIPFLMNTGISLQDAREYANGGCTEVRVPKLDTYLPQTCNVSMIPALEMALNDGYTVIAGKRGKVEEPKIKFADIKSFDDILTNYKQYVDLYIRNMYARMSIVELMDGEAAAAPFMSALHPCCLKAAEDIHKPLAGKSCGANYQDTGNIGLVGFGTVVESLIAIKKIVFEDKAVTLEKYMNAVNRNFENSEPLRQMILNAPKYGNNDPYADEIARQVDKILDEIAHKYRTPYGERYIKFVPVTVHQSLGMQTQATPNGRKAFEALSEGISPTQGYDSEGALATLTSISNARSRLYTNNAARLLNIKLSPQTVDGEEGTQNLIRLIRAWCDLKLWHLQFNIVNRETLLEAQKNPEAYRNLLVRVAGYSAFFTDLSEGMQNEIINRTEHTSC